MRRTLLALGLAGVLAMAGCGIGGGTAAPAGATTDASSSDALSADVATATIALQQVGFETGLADDPSPAAGAGRGDAPRRALRKYLRRNTLHGEVTIQTRKQGVRTVVVQRGSVTAVAADKITVKSSDGVTLSWAYGDKLRVVQDRKTVETSALKTGQEIGIAGVKDGDTNNARLIAIKK
ncbi:hypothetical protein ACFQS1_36235 [Paractinoplanes rhizophilus]|uniref:DUF5666 domain-containing protein n=1 Tax=Paractinoplanes rhizophilus TaxID=1416877 RepID=A0ABW2I3P3_9ACTN